MSSSSPALIAPLLALASWTFVMEAWMMTYRGTDISNPALKIKITPVTSKTEMEAQFPRHRLFPAHNYAHLHEQPTVFYAVCLASAVLGIDDGFTIGLAWSYVAARVVHSVIQSTSNVIMRRFTVFMISSGILLAMTLRASMRCFL